MCRSFLDPALLDGNDGFPDMPYEEVLAACTCDLGVFPRGTSRGALHAAGSAAHAVPTVTTDLSGFGLWVQDTQGQEQALRSCTASELQHGGTVAALPEFWHKTTLHPHRPAQARAEAATVTRYPARVRGIGFPHYIQAANTQAQHGQAVGSGALRDAPSSASLTRVLEGDDVPTPTLHAFTAVTALPGPSNGCASWPHNLWWSWHPECHQLFSASIRRSRTRRTQSGGRKGDQGPFAHRGA